MRKTQIPNSKSEEVQEKLLPRVWGCPITANPKTCSPPQAHSQGLAVFTHHTQALIRPCHLSGRAKGRRPSAFLIFPQDWGNKGVESGVIGQSVACFPDSRLRGQHGDDGGFLLALPALQRRGFDHGACRGPKALCVPLSSPQNGGTGGVERRHADYRHPCS